jgi:hypothetical protein
MLMWKCVDELDAKVPIDGGCEEKEEKGREEELGVL